MKVNKKAIIFTLPVLAGLTIGQIFNQTDAKIEKLTALPVNSSSTSSSKQTPRTISDYLITSQTFFSQAIELSQQAGLLESDKSSTDVNNQRVVELINEAITQATAAVLHYPTDARGWYQRAKIYQTIEKYNEGSIQAAIKDIERAVYLEPENKEYLSFLSNLWQDQGDLKKAIFYLSQAAQANPTDAQLWFELAKLQTKEGLLVQAYQSYQRIIPLIVDVSQKKLVREEMVAIESLLAQTKGIDFATSMVPTISPSTDLYLPDAPAKLEANNLAQQVIIADPENEERFASKDKGEYSSNSLSGNSLITAGDTEIEIDNANLSPDTQVYITAIGDTQNEVLKVKSKKEKSFVVSISNPISNDLEFKWWLIQTDSNK